MLPTVVMDRSLHHWTKEEDTKLLILHQSHNFDNFAHVLGRSVHSCRLRHARLAGQRKQLNHDTIFVYSSPRYFENQPVAVDVFPIQHHNILYSPPYKPVAAAGKHHDVSHSPPQDTPIR